LDRLMGLFSMLTSPLLLLIKDSAEKELDSV
jgi:hypothetical protein